MKNSTDFRKKRIVSNFTRLTAREITYNNFEISYEVFMPKYHYKSCYYLY